MTRKPIKPVDPFLGHTVIKLALEALGGAHTHNIPPHMTPQLLAFARDAGLHCLVAKALMDSGAPDASSVFQSCVTRAMTFYRDLLVLDQMLDDIDCHRAILLKGGALKYQVYPDPALRPSVDIDILIPPDALYQVVHGLMDRGFSIDPSTVLKRPLSGRLGHEISIIHPQINYMVEIHSGISQQFLFPHPVDLLVKQALPLPGFSRLKCPTLQWQLVHGAMHMAQRGFKQAMKHLLDIYLLNNLLSSREQIQQTLALAGRCHARRVLTYSIEAANIAFAHKSSPLTWLFSETGPQVLRPQMHVVAAQALTAPLTMDTPLQWLRALGMKLPLLVLDLILEKTLHLNKQL